VKKSAVQYKGPNIAFNSTFRVDTRTVKRITRKTTIVSAHGRVVVIFKIITHNYLQKIIIKMFSKQIWSV